MLRAAGLWVEEGDVVARRALADAAGGESHALGMEKGHACFEVVHPQPHVVQRGHVHLEAMHAGRTTQARRQTST